MSSSSNGSDFKTDITADPSKFNEGFKQAVQTAASSSDQINAQFKKIGDSVSKVNAMLMGFTAVLAGGGALKKFISEANDWNGTAGKMAAQLGISTEKASVLNTALKRLGVDSDVYLDGAQKLSKQVQKNGDAFKVMGIQVRDATGAYRPVTELMGEVNTKLAAIKNPIEQNIAGQQMYGKGWSEVRTLMRLTTAQMTESEARARQLGLIVGPEGVAMSKQYGSQMRDLALVGKSLEVQFGNALLPVFTRTGSFMAQEGPAAGRTFAYVIEGIAFAASAAWLAIKDMGDGLGAMAAQGAALLSGDIEGFKAIGRMRDEEAAKNEAAYERLKANFGKPLEPQALADGPDITKGPKYSFAKEGEDPAAKSRMSAWEATLAAKKAALEREGMLDGQFREMSKADELAYWQALVAKKGNTEQEKIALTRKTAEVEMGMIRESFDLKVKTLEAEAAQYKNNTEQRLRIEGEIQAKFQAGSKEYEASQKRIEAIQREAAGQALAVAQVRAQAERDARLQTLALEEQTLHQATQLGITTQAEVLQAQMGFENRRYAIADEALQARLNLAENDPDRNPVEVARIHAEIERLEQDHQLRIGQLRGQMVVESQQNMLGMLGNLQSGWASVLQNFMQGTMTVRNLVRGLFGSLVQAVTGMLAQMAAKWMVDQLALKLFGKATKVGEVSANAGVAGAAAVASTAAIPIVGPELAPAAGAAAFGAAMSFMPAVLASASGGYDIPGTINPLVQAHAKEMILPAKHADVIRDLADGGGSGGGGGNWSVELKAMPLRGGFFMMHRDDLVAALQSAKRDFVRT